MAATQVSREAKRGNSAQALTRPASSLSREAIAAITRDANHGLSSSAKLAAPWESSFVATKELSQGAASFAEDERPWFASRVMAAIASRERELAGRVSAWAEFPRFASRLTWVAAIVLLASTTWFYRSVVRAPSYPSTGSQESIFEAPQQSAPDDILISRASENP